MTIISFIDVFFCLFRLCFSFYKPIPVYHRVVYISKYHMVLCTLQRHIQVFVFYFSTGLSEKGRSLTLLNITGLNRIFIIISIITIIIFIINIIIIISTAIAIASLSPSSSVSTFSPKPNNQCCHMCKNRSVFYFYLKI